MENVQTVFAEFFAYVLLFEQMTEQGAHEPEYVQVRQEIAALLERQQAAARGHGMSEHDYQEARFAVIAWADETILKHATWRHHSQWDAFPLQLEYFQTRNAGEELFEHLEQLRPEQQAVHEIYYLCLGLGFSGQYFRGLNDDLKLAHLRHAQAQYLLPTVEAITTIDTLTPQPYAVAAPQGPPITLPRLAQLATAALLVLFLTPLGLLLTYKLFTPPVPPSALAQPVAAPVTTCTLPEIGPISPALCQVVTLLEPLKKLGEARAFGLHAQLNKSASQPFYVAGDDLAIAVQTPVQFESFVYVDYYSANGTVVHLFPTHGSGEQLLPRQQNFLINRIDGRVLEIQEPFGLELVTVVASKTPLFGSARSATEQIETYVKTLRQHLTGEGTSADMTATFVFLRTSDRRL